jgi:hypothetical protein
MSSLFDLCAHGIMSWRSLKKCSNFSKLSKMLNITTSDGVSHRL